MNALPSISSQIDEDKIFKIINKNFSKIAPFYYQLITSWLIRSYNVFQDIDKFVILIYFINKDLIFFRKNGLVINYDTFYNDKSIEIPKINISDISNDLKIPKESVRRKLQELEKKGIIKKTGKKIFVDRSAFTTAKAEQTLKELSILISKFNEILVEEKVTNIFLILMKFQSQLKLIFLFVGINFINFIYFYYSLEK
jgi:predicted DNA-binding transcriptional regulator